MEIQISETGDTVNASIRGNLNFQDHVAFNEFLARIQDKKRHVTFDLSGLDMIDSAGIGMLFLAHKIIQKSQGSMALKNPNGQVKRVFDITSISREIRVIEA